MQPPRVFIFTCLSSSLIQSLFILLLFVGSLSTVPAAVSTEESLADNATFPLEFPEAGARLFMSATLDEREKLTRSMRSDSELSDSQIPLVNKTEDAVEFEEGRASPQTKSATGTPSEYGAPNLTTISSTPNVVSSDAVTFEQTPATSSSVTSATSLTSTATTTTVTDAATTIMTTTPPTAAPQTDPAESATTTALIENSGGMPTGIVALVTMITFVIIAIVGYISLIVWRRYLEYRYGNRELLVNDLEFDTNDLRHFEL